MRDSKQSVAPHLHSSRPEWDRVGVGSSKSVLKLGLGLQGILNQAWLTLCSSTTKGPRNGELTGGVLHIFTSPLQSSNPNCPAAQISTLHCHWKLFFGISYERVLYVSSSQIQKKTKQNRMLPRVLSQPTYK